MATSAYHKWVNAGRPFKLARPIAELRKWAKTNGVPILGTIGNEAHLTSDFPEDHTPFSFTAWPDPLPGYVVTAIDLADRDDLGRAILEGARAGRYPWLKYMNFDGHTYAYADGFMNGWPNPDHHVHISIFSDEINTSIGNFDPWGDEMELKDRVDMLDGEGDRWSFGRILGRDDISVNGALGYAAAGGWQTQQDVVPSLKAAHAKLDALAKALDGIVPGVAEACSQAAADVTAEDVAGQLEIKAKG